MAEACVVCGTRLVERGTTAAEARRQALRQSIAPEKKFSNMREFLELRCGGPLLAARALVGASAASLGTYLLVLQDDVILEPGSTMVLIAYIFVGLFWTITSLLEISMRQFLLEMLAFLIVTVGLRVTIPEAFDRENFASRKASVARTGKGSADRKATGGNSHEDAALPASAPLAAFLDEATEAASEARELAVDGVTAQEWMQWRSTAEHIRTLRSSLGTEFSPITDPVMRQLATLERALETATGQDGAAQTTAVDRAADALEAEATK